MIRSAAVSRVTHSAIALIGATLLATLLLAATAVRPAHAFFSLSQPKVEVMTRNLYFGADLTRAIVAPDVPSFMAANAQIFTNVESSDIPDRERAVALEIALNRPDLVGLQEVSQWLTGPLGDPAPATHVEYDALKSLRHWLAVFGAPYKVVYAQPEMDIEAPAGAPYNEDIRLALHDVILAPVFSWNHLTLTNATGGNYSNLLSLTTGFGLPITVKRGWASVDASVNGHSFRFVDTHLESFQPAFRAAQAGELVAPTGPVGSAPGKVVLVGDMNSDPLDAFPDNVAFGVLMSAGLTDTWTAANPTDPGETCCFDELLDNPSASVFNQRIDHVLTRGGVGTVGSWTVGKNPWNRTPSGKWPSDHAGVLATLKP